MNVELDVTVKQIRALHTLLDLLSVENYKSITVEDSSVFIGDIVVSVSDDDVPPYHVTKQGKIDLSTWA